MADTMACHNIEFFSWDTLYQTYTGSDGTIDEGRIKKDL
jgi:hypothetical protein